LAILVIVVGGALAYKTWFSGGAAGIHGPLEYAKAEPLAAPAAGGFQMQTIDLGEGAVPLITVPLDTWGGYAALFAANGGAAPSKDSLFYKEGRFAVKLVHVEDATDQLKGYAAGQYPIIWAQMDSLPLLYDTLKSDKRVAPKVLGLFDWSAGGDGILAKPSVKNPADLKGKTILTSSNTPFAFFLLWYLAQNNLTGNDVKVVWVDDGAKALQLFKNSPEIAAWVSWKPYISDCLDSKSPNFVPNARLMISSKDANQLIADCYIARRDFLEGNQKLAASFVRSMLEAVDSIGPKTYQDMAAFYGLKAPAAAQIMLADVHIANYPESAMFFDPKNSIGSEKIFNLAQEYYKEIGVLPQTADYDPSEVESTPVLAAAGKAGSFSGQKNSVQNSFNTNADLSFDSLESRTVVLTDNVALYFDPNEDTFDIDSDQQEIRDNMERLDKVAEQTKFLSTTAIELVGNADPSMKQSFKDKGPQAYVEAAANLKQLSEERAAFIKKLLIEHYGLPANRVISKGVGWDNPIDLTDFSKDRRVDVMFVSMK
jgi:outer membrane protein OmpA-like peptidoglycan-associated protein